MPQIDVSDLLTDPDFAQWLERERMVERVGTNGVATEVPVKGRFVGVVVADGGRQISRTADAETVSGSITVITRERLSDGKQGESADIIRWLGQRYTVVDVNPYLNFGRGFVEARCELLSFTG